MDSRQVGHERDKGGDSLVLPRRGREVEDQALSSSEDEGLSYGTQPSDLVMTLYSKDPKAEGGRYICTLDGCHNLFPREPDLQRHVEIVHIVHYRYFCPVSRCPRSGQPFFRLHHAKEHLRTSHRGSRFGDGTPIRIEPFLLSDEIASPAAKTENARALLLKGRGRHHQNDDGRSIPPDPRNRPARTGQAVWGENYSDADSHPRPKFLRSRDQEASARRAEDSDGIWISSVQDAILQQWLTDMFEEQVQSQRQYHELLKADVSHHRFRSLEPRPASDQNQSVETNQGDNWTSSHSPATATPITDIEAFAIASPSLPKSSPYYLFRLASLRKTCIILILIGALVIYGGTAFAICWSVVNKDIQSGFTMGTYIVTIGAIPLGLVSAKHYPRCECFFKQAV